MKSQLDARDREAILSDLGSPDEEVRRLAVERLPQLPSSESIPALVEQLGDPSWRVRKSAIERLAESPDSAGAVGALVRSLADGDNPGRRNAALEALTRCGPAAVPALVAATADPDVDVRKQAVDALAGIADESAAPCLVQLLSDPDPNVCAAAADALGAVGGRLAQPALLAMAKRATGPLVRLSALRALVRLEAAVPAAALGDALEDPLLQPAAFALLGAGEDPAAAEILCKALGASSCSARDAAMGALVRLAAHADDDAALRRLGERLAAQAGIDEIVAEACQRLGEAPLPVQMVIVQFLGLLRPAAAVIPLLEAGCDEALAELVLEVLAGYGEVADHAVAEGLGRVSEEAAPLGCALLARTRGSAGEARLRSLLADEDPELRVAAIRALGERRAAGALGELISRLEEAAEEDPEVAEDECTALGDAIVAIAGGEAEAGMRALVLLEQRLESAGASFRLAAARILGSVGGPAEVPRVELLLSDPSAAVRRAAVEALSRIAPGAVDGIRLALADESAQVRIGAIAALVRNAAAGSMPDLARLLDDEDERVRAAALRAIGALAAAAPGSASLRADALATLSAGLERSPGVAMAAVEALAELGGEDAVARVRAVLASPDPELAQSAVACIGRHGGPADLQDLIPLISHPHWMVRAQAVQAMSERGVAKAVPAILRRMEVEQDDFVREAMMAALERLER